MLNTTRFIAQEESTHTGTFSVPRPALLEGFVELCGVTDGIDLSLQASGAQFCLQTMNSEYRMRLLDPATRRVVIQGGGLFREPTEAWIYGSSGGGSMLRVGWIGAGLQLEFRYLMNETQSMNVLTSPIQHLFLERATV